MEQLKSALKSLEEAVFRLETAVHGAQKRRLGCEAKIDELKQAIKTTHDRLDKALLNLKPAEE